MNVLVSAASKHGATAQIAEAIAAGLARHGMNVTIQPPEEVAVIDEYDAVVLGSAVYAGQWMKSAKDLVERLADALKQRPVWLFSSGPIGEPPLPKDHAVDVERMLELAGARDHRVFAGELVKKRLSFVERAVTTALRAPEGDFRNWEAIARWTDDIAADLPKPRETPADARSRG